ncbi:MAG: class I SAM-dependent methyltransferase [Promethearchaeota archaeon]
MSESKPNDKKIWNSRAERYDEWYKTFQGAVENYVDWELLKKHLPKNKNAKILDAAGGTGRITLLLARMGYSLTLCDISSGMLAVATQKMFKEGVSEKVKILECDVRHLQFADETFDFVVCWNGTVEGTKELAVKEIIRVTKKRGRMSIFLDNKWVTAINNFYKDPDSILASIESLPSYVQNEDGKHWVVSVEEARNLFEEEGIRVIEIYAVCGWMNVLRIPKKVLNSRTWDKKLFDQTTKMVLRLSKEPSVKGMSKHLVLYGEKL